MTGKIYCSIFLFCLETYAIAADQVNLENNDQIKNKTSFIKYDFFKHLKKDKNQQIDIEKAIEIANEDLNQEQKNSRKNTNRS